ncbi:MAG: DUF2939 domain-containing protein [Candidatus Thiodiazotropha sp. (ex Dulcina madagascariensis)]|nr:DUF2939 domain-containing protein [Candidatus Thiodiazotropha sp. (ex Epidulcina cf. delphinae)]MCU7921178.1 DUF2939 domain-containing protein [Candidatus Thiodiazotropha sp. (ex Dulcina madagascariensis)]MCU7925773.1 DUF2939 domain-containing protein [Candidatus Thiodiazotropha sp. (ex Dulcina madagascariensis)]MCU7933995.1 DUF2939 domain-containing protein [Candidatus Thiodiazotropha sp. (ex Dulcina madagascariensis)]
MKGFIVAVILAAAAFLIWPYTAVYRLDQALQRNDHRALAELIDVEAVRDQIKRKLNKNLESTIGDVSSGFIDWLQNGIQRLGADAVEQMVDIGWIAAQLRAHNRKPGEGGILDRMTYAFFDGPDRLLLRIGEWDDNPVHAHLSLQGADWRITAVYN